MTCSRCGHRWDLSHGFAGIHFSHGLDAAEQLSNGRALHLCPECADLLRTWLGRPPLALRHSENAIKPPPPIPQPPVSRCTEP